ncbi:MAG: hypothetical protein WD061_01710 [Candidatus Saccharimonadales bacterium]
METEKRDLDKYRVGLKTKTASIIGAIALALTGCSFENRLSSETKEVLNNPEALSMVVCAEDLQLKIDELIERSSQANSSSKQSEIRRTIKNYQAGYRGMVESGYDDPDCEPDDLPGKINVPGRGAVTAATLLDK